ncbi:unnamed protein product [Pleuronectes platessa]|uniref:Uncharacterized protein n=1 Tax=Pleuronectes platessa TaxID=8262 RepID=A0A9N7Z3T3_PLEPL|nr:unnamed protein product [Pleuronectes platessa]
MERKKLFPVCPFENNVPRCRALDVYNESSHPDTDSSVLPVALSQLRQKFSFSPRSAGAAQKDSCGRSGHRWHGSSVLPEAGVRSRGEDRCV